MKWILTAEERRHIHFEIVEDIDEGWFVEMVHDECPDEQHDVLGPFSTYEQAKATLAEVLMHAGMAPDPSTEKH